MSIVPLHIPINEIDKYFYNRKEDIKKIEYYLNSLELGISQSLLIRGVRGVGKTFLLQKIKQDSKKNFIVSYVDVSRIVGKDDTHLNAQSVLLELLDEMNNSIGGLDNGAFAEAIRQSMTFNASVFEKSLPVNVMCIYIAGFTFVSLLVMIFFYTKVYKKN